MPIRVGIDGYGRWGRIRCNAFAKNPDVQLCAVYDVNVDLKPMVESLGMRFYTDPDDMLKKESLNLVDVSTPASKHKEMVYKALEYGVNVLVEKPMATTIDDAIVMTDKAKESNLLLHVGFTERSSPTALEMREILLSGHIGDIISIDGKKRVTSFHRAWDVGAALDVAIHYIDKAINFHKKRVVEVYAVARKIRSEEHEDFINIFMTFEDNVLAHIEADRTRNTREHEFELNGTRGSCEEDCSDPNWENHYLKFRRGFVEDVGGLAFKDLEEYFNRFNPQKAKTEIIKPRRCVEPAKMEVDRVVETLVNKSLPPISLEEALQSTKVAILALESSRNHKPIDVEKYWK